MTAGPTQTEEEVTGVSLIQPLWLVRQARVLMLERQARAARARAEQSRSAAHVEQAVALSRRALKQAPPGHPQRAALLNTLSGTLRFGYVLTGNADALREAISASREAVADPQGAPFRGPCLCTLAVALRLEHERTREPGGLAEAEATAREAVAATGEGHPQHAVALLILANVMLTRHEITGDVAAAREAAQRAEQAAGSPSVGAGRGSALNTLANARLLLHRATADDDTLREAADAAQHALEATPPGDPNRAGHANTLASVLLTRYGRTGRTADLREAVRASRMAADAVPPGHVLRAVVLHTLVGTLLELHGRRGEKKILDEAVETAREALDLASDALLLPGLHNALSMAMMMRYLSTGDAEALGEARAEASRACDAAGDTHPQRFVFLSNLAKALRAEYEKEPTPDLLDELVETGRLVAAGTTGTALYRADHLIELVLALLHEHQHRGDPDVLSEARDHAAEAAARPYVLPWQQVAAHRLLGRVELALGDRGAALDAYRIAVESLPRVAPQRLERMDRELGLGKTAGLGPEAASAALAAGAPEAAVELLEQARGVLIEERLGARSETARLAERHPALAGEFERIRVLLDLPEERLRLAESATLGEGLPAGAPAGLREAERADRRRVWLEEQWDGVLARIRALEGFEDFQGRPSITKLRREAAAGPVVLVNASVHGCDALILTDDPERPVRAVPLPDVTERTVAEQVTGLHSAREARQDIGDVLRWVWGHVTEPVLSALGHTGPRPLDRRPRLWWVATGPFAFLPLHAAGHHSREEVQRCSGRTVMDRVISSYTPTVRALGHARRAASAAPDGPRGVLIVAMPETPGESPLVGVDKEVGEITGVVPDAEILSGRQATREAVLSALPRHQIAHFACHGVSEPGDPSTSRLLLDDHLAAPLDVAVVSRLDLRHAELAYLSACSTTETTGRFGDESVHITAAFLLAGFAGIVGTLWPVQDAAARRIAAAFYRQAFAQEATSGPVDRAAYALQYAVDRLRAKRPGLPALWSAHIHVGV